MFDLALFCKKGIPSKHGDKFSEKYLEAICLMCIIILQTSKIMRNETNFIKAAIT